MQSILVDTGPLYAAYDSSDRYHNQAQQELQRLNQQRTQILLSYLVLAECHNLLLKRFNTSIGIRFLQDMASGALLLHPTSDDYQAATQRLQRYTDQTITLCDATTAAMGDRLKLDVWTYDFHFDVMGSQIWRSPTS